MGTITTGSVTMNGQTQHWSIARRIAGLTGMNTKDCRAAARVAMQSGNSYCLYGHDAERSAFEFVRTANEVSTQSFKETLEDTAVSVELEYNFDYSLVQAVADLAKEHGYDNVMQALKMYNKLVKGL